MGHRGFKQKQDSQMDKVIIKQMFSGHKKKWVDNKNSTRQIIENKCDKENDRQNKLNTGC